MKKYLSRKLVLVFLLVNSASFSYSQKGSLFIIGGGDRPTNLMNDLVKTANLKANEYIVILPMASGVPVESVESISKQLSGLCNNHITSFNFDRAQANENQPWIDSVRNARLIYITGGDQNRFMDIVRGTSLFDAMHESFRKGGTVSGTSAGAAIMSHVMITGEERAKKENGGFREIESANAVTSQGMGFMTTAIIDQHFIKRSRYNRLMSVMADHPDKMVIGIDEATAIIVKGKKVSVTGESQVVVISKPKKLRKTEENKIGFTDAQLSLYISGDQFKIK
ncbi:MAG: cyanophycinase [Ginsengibacter sp.]